MEKTKALIISTAHRWVLIIAVVILSVFALARWSQSVGVDMGGGGVNVSTPSVPGALEKLEAKLDRIEGRINGINARLIRIERELGTLPLE